MESEERYRTVAETASDGIFVIDETSTVLYVNRAAETIFGYSVGEIMGHQLTMLMPDYLRHVHRAALQRYVHTGKKHITWEGVELPGLHRDGHEVSLEISFAEFMKAGKHIFTGIVRDVTDRKKAERALLQSEKLAATGRIAATIAHEINNPLEAITNLLYLATEKPSGASEYLRLAGEELERVSHLARQTLGFYRHASAPVTVNIPATLDEVLEVYKRRLQSKQILVHRRYEAPAEIQAFAGEIRQVFSNLIANAIDALGDGGRLVLRVTSPSDWTRELGPFVRVTVADNGCGISPQDRNKLFQPFFTTKDDVGTGLGLWISRSIVEKHGGTLQVRSSSRPGATGTVFSVLLPKASRRDRIAATA